MAHVRARAAAIRRQIHNLSQIKPNKPH
jgi:hypothetical protein